MIELGPHLLSERLRAGTVFGPSMFCVVSGLDWFGQRMEPDSGAWRPGHHPRSFMSFAMCPQGSHSLSLGLRFLNGKMKCLE